jgi:hypothetical protein
MCVFCSSTWPGRLPANVAEWDLAASVPALPCRRPPAASAAAAVHIRSRPSPCWPDIAEHRATRPLVAAALLSASMSRRGAVLQASRAPFASSRYPGARRAEVADGHVREWHGGLAASDVARPELAPLLIFRSNSVQFGVRRRQWSDKRSPGASITICARPL